MARDFQINGECLVLVKGNSASSLPSLIELGLSESPVTVTPMFRRFDIKVDAWGGSNGPPADVQWMLAEAQVSMTLVHFDRTVLAGCVREGMAGSTAEGTLVRAGVRMGGNVGRFAPGNHYVGLNLTAPANAIPWRFFYAYLSDNPFTYPLGVERSVVQVTWRVVPYTMDPYGGSTTADSPDPTLAQPGQVYGGGAGGVLLWDHVLDA